MATKKTKTPRAKVTKIVQEVEVSTAKTTKKLSGNKMNFIAKVLLVVIIGVALFMLANKYRGLVLAGVVNKTPITRWQLNQAMAKRYGKTTLDELVSNSLIKQEAAKANVTVAAEEIAAEVKKLEERIGGEAALKDALVQYGLTQKELEEQIRVSILQKKIIEAQNSFAVTEEEVKEYFKTNATSFANKKLEEVKDEITALLKDQKMQQAFATWFAEVKSKARIESYLD